MSDGHSRRGRIFARLRGALPWALTAALLVAFLVILGNAVIGGDGDEGPAAALAPPESSWVPGQGSVVRSAAYLAIAGRATTLAELRLARRARELELIEARKEAAQKRKRDEALRRFREARRRALARFRAALRRAARLRAERQRELERLKRERARRLRELLEKLKVKPGEECRLPEVRREFDCLTGRLPLRGEE